MDCSTFVLFGATGDLAKRKIIPALFELFLSQKLPTRISIIGSSITEYTDDEFHNYVKSSIDSFSHHSSSDSKLSEFLHLIRYCKVDVTKGLEYERLLSLIKEQEAKLHIPENRLYYLSVAPQFFDVIVKKLQETKIVQTNGWKRLLIEKPFGHDVTSARELNEKFSCVFEEKEIYRIDHYLGKPMVQNLETLEFANPVLQTLWNNEHIANVQITASEIVGVEKRAAYYEKAGAIRDMFQNHLLQLLMMFSMHFPNGFSAKNIRQEKRKVMEAVRPIKKEDVFKEVIRGQYGPGEINDEQVIGYKKETGVDSSSTNDTFIAARLWIDDSLWKGVPFYIRTGKRMKEKSTRIVIEFKNPLTKYNKKTEPNLLEIGINPESEVSLQLNSRNPLKEGAIEPIHVDFTPEQRDIPEAYENILVDALEGDATFFAHWKEVELSWLLVQPILEAFKENLVPLHEYPSGSYGPKAAHILLEEDGFFWWSIDNKNEKEDIVDNGEMKHYIVPANEHLSTDHRLHQ
ncbi:glucose-6-phosphate dehydrogenase [Metabacillus niabensis]|uniref:glucose-6-phosphate dehydrogenase n=1 Tax=Metabacillus niabensis TaxID=324854 RepID=UPI001CFBB63D